MTTIKKEVDATVEELRSQMFQLDSKIGDLESITNTLNGLRELLSDINENMQAFPNSLEGTSQIRIQSLLDLLTYTNKDLEILNKDMEELHTPMFQNVFKLTFLEKEQ
ncbi:hypothetical protein [Psychrobacillus sp. L3]|uniref:hypothetical protein n=1 Tax=Psychrobacillus sp. L3 TaxID=3236891 RepID=UPI0036F34DB5